MLLDQVEHNKALQHAHFVCWTVCKLRFCGFASQKYSTTRNLQTAAELNVMCENSYESKERA